MKKRLKMQSDKVQASAQLVATNSSKLFGVGAMVVVGLFGLLLATQIISPSSSAETSENTSCVSDEAAAKTASQLGFYETRPTDDDWETEALQYVLIELTASELAEVEKGDNSWIGAHKIEECFELVSTIRRESILSLDKWLTGRRLWKFKEAESTYWMPAAEAEEYAKRLNAHQTEQDEQRSQFEERRRQAEQAAEQEAEREVAEEVEEPVVDNPPVVVLDHKNTVMTATATDDNLNPDSWQNAGSFAAEPDCESEDLAYSPAGSDQYSLTLTVADNDQWYCFKVSDTGNNTGYVKYQVKGVFIEEEDNTNPNQEDTNDNEMNDENDPDRDNTDDQEDNNDRTDSNNGGSVVRQDTGSGGSGNGNPQQSSRGATATPAESVSTSSIGGGGDQADIPDTGIADEQGWLQLLGVAIMLVAVLGSARILIAKKRHQRT